MLLMALRMKARYGMNLPANPRGERLRLRIRERGAGTARYGARCRRSARLRGACAVRAQCICTARGRGVSAAGRWAARLPVQCWRVRAGARWHPHLRVEEVEQAHEELGVDVLLDDLGVGLVGDDEAQQELVDVLRQARGVSSAGR
eukprot:scaffold50708_cov54-Phaeocystis_antarctica.AAC.1